MCITSAVAMSKFRFYTDHRFCKSQICTNCDANMLETAEQILLEYKCTDIGEMV